MEHGYEQRVVGGRTFFSKFERQRRIDLVFCKNIHLFSSRIWVKILAIICNLFGVSIRNLLTVVWGPFHLSVCGCRSNRLRSRLRADDGRVFLSNCLDSPLFFSPEPFPRRYRVRREQPGVKGSEQGWQDGGSRRRRAENLR